MNRASLLRTIARRGYSSYASPLARRTALRSLSMAIANANTVQTLHPLTSSQFVPFKKSNVRTFASDTFLDVNEVKERVLSVVKSFEKVDQAKVTEKSHFAKDLGLDSLDAVELVMAFEEEFVIEIPDAEAEKILTCEDAIKFIAAHPQAK